MSKTFATMFSGVGGAELGLTRAGYQPTWSVEWNLGALNILADNHNIPLIIHDDVCDVDYSKLPKVDLLWASPVCCNFSRANHNCGETYDDHRSAHAVIAAAKYARSVIIENVPAYQKSKSFISIVKGLVDLGFTEIFTPELEASEFGNPSRRLRFYGVFSRQPIDNDILTARLLCKLEPRSNWFVDLINTVGNWEQSKLTANQLKAIGDRLQYPHEPFAIERCGYYGAPKIIPASLIFPTLKSHPGHDGKNPKAGYGKIGSYRRQYDFIHEGQSYALTPQLTGILMGFPIDYDWGVNRAQAVAGIGNAVVPRMAQIVAKLINHENDRWLEISKSAPKYSSMADRTRSS